MVSTHPDCAHSNGPQLNSTAILQEEWNVFHSAQTLTDTTCTLITQRGHNPFPHFSLVKKLKLKAAGNERLSVPRRPAQPALPSPTRPPRSLHPCLPHPPATDAFMTSGSWQVLGYGLKHHGPIFCAFSAFTMETWWICKKKKVCCEFPCILFCSKTHRVSLRSIIIGMSESSQYAFARAGVCDNLSSWPRPTSHMLYFIFNYITIFLAQTLYITPLSIISPKKMPNSIEGKY